LASDAWFVRSDATNSLSNFSGKVEEEREMFGERMGRKFQRRALPAILVVGLLGLGAPAPGLGVEISDIPKPQRWVTDLTASIPSTEGLEIEEIGDRIERETGGQLVVVVVRTLDGKESRPFATELFNAWGIGRAKQDDGLLIFAALEDHRIELLLGSGIDDPERQRASDEIVQQVMVPQFKAGNPSYALLLGVRECARRIYGLADPVPSGGESTPVPPVATPWPAAAPLQAFPNPGAGSGRTSADGGELGLLGTLVGFVALCALFVVWVFRRGWLGTRVCPSCGIKMVQLNEAADDAHLGSGEVAEERLGSVDYDVWACPACNQVSKFRHGSFFTSYRRCPGCNFVTASEVTTVLRRATTFQGGLVQVDESCANCNYTDSTTHSTPRLVDTSNHSYHSYSSSVSSSSSSNSSSGSGSFGGGSTSGGGSSGHW
jgi:uncharacterized protein